MFVGYSKVSFLMKFDDSYDNVDTQHTYCYGILYSRDYTETELYSSCNVASTLQCACLL